MCRDRAASVEKEVEKQKELLAKLEETLQQRKQESEVATSLRKTLMAKMQAEESGDNQYGIVTEDAVRNDPMVVAEELRRLLRANPADVAEEIRKEHRQATNHMGDEEIDHSDLEDNEAGSAYYFATRMPLQKLSAP
eukprot:15457169-Alexandrium_andersonii.AAC.1